MAERLYEKDEDGCLLEKSQRVRDVLKQAIAACQKPVPPGFYPPVTEAPSDDPPPERPPEVRGEDDEEAPGEVGETTQVLPNGAEITAPRMAKTVKTEPAPTIDLDEAVVQPQGVQPPVKATPKVERKIIEEAAPAKPYFEEESPALPVPQLPGPSLLGPEVRQMEAEPKQETPEEVSIDDFVQAAPSHFEGKISGIYASRGLAQLQLPGECRVAIGDQVDVLAGSRSVGTLRVVGFAGPHAVAKPQGSLSATDLKQGQLVKVGNAKASVAQAPVLSRPEVVAPTATQKVAAPRIAVQPVSAPAKPASVIQPVVLQIDLQEAVQQPNRVQQADLPEAPLPPQ